jgi:hypothetical protein
MQNGGKAGTAPDGDDAKRCHLLNPGSQVPCEFS